MSDKFLGAGDRPVILDALGAGRGIEHALDRVLEVGAGDTAPVGKARIAAQMEGEDGRVRRGLPGGREVGHEIDTGIAVADQRIEDHLLEHPRLGVVAGGGIEGWDIGDGGQLEDHRAGREREWWSAGAASGECESYEYH